jgi:hypothetical protein
MENPAGNAKRMPPPAFGGNILSVFETFFSKAFIQLLPLPL